ncbi:MAG TPA: hypothetical protein DCD96_05785 [Flavobacteriales bacterium]|nr:hypothetical protein [Flavobacteriales bacterium]
MFLFLGALLFNSDVEAQCAMCKAVAETGSQGQDQSSIGEQLNIGIIFLMAIPYLFILIIPMILFRRHIKGFFRELRDVHK